MNIGSHPNSPIFQTAIWQGNAFRDTLWNGCGRRHEQIPSHSCRRISDYSAPVSHNDPDDGYRDGMRCDGQQKLCDRAFQPKLHKHTSDAARHYRYGHDWEA